MSSVGSVKKIIVSSWKLVLAFILGAVVHALYQEWAAKNGSPSFASRFGLLGKKPVAKKPAAQSKTIIDPLPVPVDPIEEFAPYVDDETAVHEE